MTTVNIDIPGRTHFVPADLDGRRWENLQPLYEALLDRDLQCSGCLEEFLLDRSELDAAAREAQANLYIAMTCHTEDEQAKRAYLDFVEEVEPELKKAGFALDKKIAGCPQAADLDPKRYGVMLRDIAADVEIFREENVALQMEDTKLGQRYAETCGAMTVTWDGQERSLPQMSRYQEETDRAVREATWRLVAERRHADHEKLSGIFDEMIGLRHRMARNARFENYRDYMFTAKHRFDYAPADCEAFHRAAEEVCVPVFRALNRERGEALGVGELRPWDLAVDIKGRAPLRPFETVDELVERTSKLYHRMSPALGEMFDRLRGGGRLDLDARMGKAPGGYQESRDRSRTPFIFMNASGVQRDLETMIHEAGHAFHSMLSRPEPLLHYRHAPIEFAEVASMSMELLAHRYLGEFYDDASAARAKRRHLEEISRLLPWIATIDAFQHWLYTHPNHDREERRAYWLELDERFGAAVSWAGLEAYRATTWQRQLHLFEVPFYYIEYGIAQLGALQLWLRSREDEQDAIARYTKALALGGSRPLPELFAAAGLTFEFDVETVRRLMDAVQEELQRLPM